MGFYLVACSGPSCASAPTLVSGPAAYVLAIVPALPVIGVFWAVMRFLIEEPDEFVRLMLVRQAWSPPVSA